MTAYLLALYKWIEKRKQSERAILLVGFFIVIYFLWITVLIDPSNEKKSALDSQLQAVNQQLEVANGGIRQVLAGMTQTVDPQLIQQKQTLEQQIKEVNSKLGISEDGQAAVQQVIQNIKSIIESDKDLNMVKLDSTSDLITDKQDNKTTETTLALTKHDITIEVLGTYFGVMNYLQHLEKMNTQFYFHNFDYTVATYPQAKVVIKLHVITP